MLDRVGHLGLKALVGLRMLELSVVLGQGAGLDRGLGVCNTWVVVKNMVPLWVLIIIRHLIFRAPKKGP